MKKQKFLLPVLALALVLVLASCSGGVPHDGECFVFEENEILDEVCSYEGKIIGSNSEYNLIALENTEQNPDGNVLRIVRVVDISTGKELYYGTLGSDHTDVTFNLSQYPLIKVNYTANTYVDGVLTDVERTDVYRIERYGDYSYGASGVAYGVENDTSRTERVGNLFVCHLEDSVAFVGADLRLVREIPKEISDSYTQGSLKDFFNIYAENRNFLYAYEFKVENRMVVVYAPDGIATAKYNFHSGTMYTEGVDTPINPSVFVLNNGDVLIQECIKADADKYDFVFAGQYMDLKTSVMNKLDGTVTELDCNFIIDTLESYYDGVRLEKSAFPLTLSGAYENQAYIIDIVNGALDVRQRYVVLDNEAKICYELKNDYLALDCNYSSITEADAEGYIATATVHGRKEEHRFDYDGNIVYTRPARHLGETDNYYYTRSGVYTKSGKLAYDIEGSAFGGNPALTIKDYGNRIILSVLNFETNANDYYVFDEESEQFVLFADGKYATVTYTNDNVLYYVYDSDKLVTTVYNLNGDVVVKVSGNKAVTFTADAAYVEVEISGNNTVYVITANSIKAEEEQYEN